jgi:hypothetical protein
MDIYSLALFLLYKYIFFSFTKETFDLLFINIQSSVSRQILQFRDNSTFNFTDPKRVVKNCFCLEDYINLLNMIHFNSIFSLSLSLSLSHTHTYTYSHSFT